ncbi:MAG: hypothetical protein ACRDP7_03565 [Trebonia sp.]
MPVVRLTGTRRRDITAEAHAAVDVRGKAVLLHAGDDARFGTPRYDADAHFLTRDGAAWLAPASRRSSASTRSTSTTPQTAKRPRTPCSSPLASPPSST